MFGQRVIYEIRRHAEICAPAEACGVVAGGEFHPCKNSHPDPEGDFFIGADELLGIERMHGRIEAVLHSHIEGPDHPSRLDMASQMAMAVPWGIVVVRGGVAQPPFWFGDRAPIPPLIERPFRHGVTDCYALVRDWYRIERGITLPDFPRDHEWWEKGGNLLLAHFDEAGFYPIDRPTEAGDAVIGRVRGSIPNHCGVYIGRGLILHHLCNRLSRTEPIGPWMKLVTHSFRRKEEAAP